MRRSNRTAPFALPLLALLLLGAAGSCFEEPVRDDLHVELAADGSARLRLETTLDSQPPVGEAANPALARRLESERRQREEGSDDWARRIRALESPDERLVQRREGGVLVAVERTAALPHASALEDLFADTLVQAAHLETDGLAELSFVPLAPGRASPRERQRLERATGDWTDAVARYFRASRDLYRHLDLHPDRAEDCFAELLSGSGPEGDDDGSDGDGDGDGEEPDIVLTPREEALVRAVEEAMAEAWDVLVVPADEAASLNEISRLAHDPFPARLTVTVPGEIVERQGFELAASGELTVPGVTLWDALRSVSGVWLSPDPMARIVEESLRPTGGLDPEALAVEPRRWAEPLPDGVEIRRVLEERMVPEPVYRVVWRTGSPR